MANNPKKVKDPTEVALSAIQEALNIADAPSGLNLERADQKDRGDRPALPRSEAMTPAPSERLAPSFDEDVTTDQIDLNRVEAAPAARRPANDDRETIGQLLQAIQKGRPRRNAYTFATIFSGLWIVGIGALIVAFLPSLQTVMAQGGGILMIAGLAALLFAPILLFYFLASLSWRGQELEHDRAIDGADGDPLFGAGRFCARIHGHCRPGDPPRGRRDGRRRRARDRARRRARSARLQRGRGA